MYNKCIELLKTNLKEVKTSIIKGSSLEEQTAVFDSLADLQNTPDKNYLLVNCGTPEDSLWIFVKKEQDDWVAYLPSLVSKELEAQLQKKLTQINGQKLIFQHIDCSENIQSNGMDKISSNLKCNAITFERIFQYFELQQPNNLKQYRATVPMDYLLEQVLRQGSVIGEAQELEGRLRYRFLWGQDWLNQKSDFDKINSIIPDNVRESLEKLIEKFEKGEVKISNNTLSIEVDNVKTMDPFLNLITGLLTQLHYPQVDTLCIKSCERKPRIWETHQDYNNSLRAMDAIDKLLQLNPNLLTVIPEEPDNNNINLPDYLYTTSCCAARNRFGLSMHPEGFNPQSHSTGDDWIEFYTAHEEEFDLNFVSDYLEKKRNWSKHYFSASQKPQNDPQANKKWIFAQFAQMGTVGLDYLFAAITQNYVYRWDAGSKKPAPNIPAFFDLSGMPYNSLHHYLKTLKSKIEGFNTNPQGCYPLFKSLSLILPEAAQKKEFEFIVNELIPGLCQHKNTFPEQGGEIILYNMPIDNKQYMDMLPKASNQTSNSSPGFK